MATTLGAQCTLPAAAQLSVRVGEKRARGLALAPLGVADVTGQVWGSETVPGSIAARPHRLFQDHLEGGLVLAQAEEDGMAKQAILGES